MTKTHPHNEPSPPHSRVKKRSNHVLYLFIITIMALTGGFYFYQKNFALKQNQLINGPSSETEIQTSKVQPINGDTIEKNDSEPTEVINSKNVTTDVGQIPQNEIANVNKESDNVLTAPLEQETTIEHTKIVDYQLLVNDLNNFYLHLDSQQYMKDFNLSESSKDHFSKLIQKLIDNPPVVTRETDDLFTLLKNTAHFFRIIGKRNIFILKGILDREKTSFETVLQSFYQLTSKPKYLQDAYAISLDSNALYDYACFFLNTMGGRLYLFRRDSNSRMAVSYYSILIIDRANISGDSRHGIHIRAAVNSLIEEIENGGNNLKLRDTYLDTLYDLKEKYN